MIRLLLLVSCVFGLDYSGNMVKVRTTSGGQCLGKIATADCNGDTANDAKDAPISSATSGYCEYNMASCLAITNATACGALRAATSGLVDAASGHTNPVCLWIPDGSCDGNASGLAAGHATAVNLEKAACNSLSNAVWTPTCLLQTNGTTTTGVALTANSNAFIETPNPTGAAIEFSSAFVVGVKAFPLGTAAAADNQGGIYFKTSVNDMWGVGVPFATEMANTTITGSSVTAPMYGFWHLDTAAIKFTQWTTAGVNNAASSEAVAAWACQATTAQNSILGTGLVAASSGGQVITGRYVTMKKWLTDTSCTADAEVTAAGGGHTYEKVQVLKPTATSKSGLSNQTACVQSAIATSYDFTCHLTTNGSPHEIWYNTYTDSTCSAGAGTAVKFTQATPCVDADGSGGGTVHWKIMNSAAEWNNICGWTHSGKMVQVQTQSTCLSQNAATRTVSNQVTDKMFPITIAADSNFTGQFLSADFKLFNMGLPFAAKQAQINGSTNVNEVLYASFGLDATNDVTMTAFEAIPPSSAFAANPTANGGAATWYAGSGLAGATAVAIVGGLYADANGGGDGDPDAGWQCTVPNSGGGISTGYGADNTRTAVTASLKWVTIRQAADCAANATLDVLNHATVAGITYEQVTATKGSTPSTGCQKTGTATAYSFHCSGADIVYNTYASGAGDCSGTATTVTFTTAAPCQVVGSKGWWIQNSSTDWEAICPAPTPAPTTASGASSASGSATSDAAVAATAAALAAGAAALIL